MGIFSSVKKAFKQAIPIATAAAGAYLGGPSGAAAGYNVGSGLSGGSSILSGSLGVGQDMLQSQYNMAMQKEMAAYNTAQQLALNDDAFQKNLTMWNLKNAYDSPEQQMKRYEAAGLNKNLIYGQSNVSGTAPTFEAPTYNAGQYQPVDKSIERAQLALALESQHQQVRNQAIENDLARQRLVLAAKEADRADKLANAQIYAISHNLALTDAKIDNTLNPTKPYENAVKSIYNNYADKVKSAVGDFVDWVYPTHKIKYGTVPKVRTFGRKVD